MSRETVLITGATSGIGLELVKIFAENGNNLILTARSETALQELAEQLQQTHHIDVKYYAKDLSDPDAPFAIYRQLELWHIEPTILVNNAGYGLFGDFVQTELTAETAMIELNIKSLTVLTKLFLQQRYPKNSGRILNVASTAAFQPGPLMAVYYATKAYVLSFSEALSEELSKTNITVTTLCPGPTESNFQRTANMMKSNLFRSGIMTAQSVAVCGYQAMMAGKRIAIPGWKNRFLTQTVRFSPRSLVLKVVRKMQENRK